MAQDNPWRAKSPSVADARAVRPYMQDATLNEVAVYFAKVYIYLPISVYNPILFLESHCQKIFTMGQSLIEVWPPVKQSFFKNALPIQNKVIPLHSQTRNKHS